MPVKNETQLDYFMDVVLRQYCRASEECEVLYGEMQDMRNCLSILFQENADLRFRLTEAGIEAPISNFVTAEETVQISDRDLV